MKFHADQPLNNSIEAIGDGWVRIAGQEYRQSLLLSHDGKCQDWPVQHMDELSDSDMAALDTEGVELVILGTGSKHRVIHPKQAHPLINKGLGVECMNSAAACRTYNVLIAEGRHVLLALIQEAQA